MAATTTLLGLVTPTQGTLSGTWGDTVNYGISDYLDISIAGTLSFAGDGAITLANTTGSASGNNIGSTTAQYMVIRITGTQTVTKVITGPSYSKLYMVDHAGATSAVTFKAAGQTGVSIAVGEKCFVYYNGTDYVKVAPYFANGVLPVANGGTGQTSFTNGQLLIGNTTGNTLTKATLTAGSGIGITEGAGSITISNTASVAAATPTALGTVYGRQTTSGGTPYLTAYGYNAGVNSTGVRNTAMGVSALEANTTGNWNVAIGDNALLSNVSGVNNTAVGAWALRLNTTDNNSAFGTAALSSVTSGTEQVAIGASALSTLTTGARNTAVGKGAMQLATTAETSVAVGINSGYQITTGAQNTLLGSYAGNTGTNNLTTGSNNILIGYQAAASSASVSNEITLGNSSITKLRVPGLSVDWAVDDVPFRNIPQNAQAGSYTLVLADSGKHIYHASGDGAATYTIPAASSVAYPIGTAITFVNLSATSISIAITSDTMYLSSAGTTGTRTLAQYGSATAIKVSGVSSSGIWVISGSALT